MMSKKAKRKILTAAVLCACTSFWVTPVWAQQLVGNPGSMVLVGNDISQVAPVEDKEVIMDESINNGEVQGVYGGYALGGKSGWSGSEVIVDGTMEANKNKVTIDGGKVTGGEIILNAIGSDFRLEFDNAAVVGGFANYASYNEVYVNDGIITTDIIGGYSLVHSNKDSMHPEITSNKVYIKGGTVTGANIVGAYLDSYRKDGNSNIVKNNSVTIEGGTIKASSDTEGNIYGAWANDNDAVLESNTVYIKNNADVTTNKSEDNSGVGIFGAYGQGKHTSAINNKVEISGGTINGNIYGAYANVASSDSQVSGNLVIITGGTINGNVYAGDSNSGKNISNNSIRITGDADLGQANLYGWDQQSDYYAKTGIVLDVNKYIGETGEIAKFNNVYIQNKSEIKVNSIKLYTHFDENDNEVCGNLTVDNSRLNANEIGYVNQLKVQNGGELKADTIDLFNGYYGYSDVCGDLTVDNSKIEVNNLGYTKNILLTNSEAKIKNLDYFDSLTIDNDNTNIASLGNIKGQNDGATSVISTDSKFTADSIKNLKALNIDMTSIGWEKDTAVVDVSGTADFTGTSISASGTFLAAAAGTEVQNGDRMSLIKAGELKGVSAADVDIDKLQIGFATEAKVEMQDGGNSIDFVITGAQQANEQAGIIGESRTAAIAFVNQGSDILNNAFGLMDDGKYGIKTFAAAHGNYSKYETGSHVRVNGWSMIAGVGNSDKLEDGTFNWGVFFENGSGNYRTYNDYNGYNLRGFGSAVYNGGGALARYRSNAGNYAEIGLRAGMLKNSLGNAVADGYGVQGGYDEETSYYGAHLGVGHIFAVDENSNVDVYGKYFYNHHESEDLNILGDEVRFDSADSNRLRLGLRYNQNDGNAFSHYYGLAWDYEFSGDANVTAAGFDTGNPSLKGSTAVIEAGIHYAPDNSPWSIDLGLQGYGGQRDGFSGTMQLNYSFN